MQTELVKRWATALRSGEYKQGSGALRISGTDTEEYCCLGVLCDIVGVEWKGYDPVLKAWRAGDDNAIAFLPKSLAENLGLDDNTQRSLSRLNDGWLDGEPSSFGEIADFIERELLSGN